MTKECRCAFNVSRVLLQIKMAQDSLEDNDGELIDVHVAAVDSALNDVESSCGVDALGARGEVDKALNFLSDGKLNMAKGALVACQTDLVEDLARCAGRYDG